MGEVAVGLLALVKRLVIYVPTNVTAEEFAALIQELLGACDDLATADGDWDEHFSPRQETR